MTAEATGHILDLALPPTEKLAALLLADSYGFECFGRQAGVSLIARYVGVSPATAESLLMALTRRNVCEIAGDELFLTSSERAQRDTSLRARPVRSRNGFVYLLENLVSPGVFKIGRTRNPKSRLATFGVQLPFDVEYAWLIKTDDMYALEAALHERFAADRIRGEWFALSPEDIAYIQSLGSAV